MIDINEIPKNKVVTLYSEDIHNDFDEFNEFVSGFIVAYNNEKIVLACLDHYGENNGFLLLKSKSIYRIDYGSYYEKKLKSLYDLKKEKHESINFYKKNSSFIQQILLWAYQMKKIILVKFPDSETELCGYFEDLETNKIKVIDQYECKPEQGNSYINPEKADYIWVDGRRLRDADLVYKSRKDNKNAW